MIDRSELETQKLVAHFMTASSPLETYLQQHGTLTALQVQSLSITLGNLQTFLDIWKRKEGHADMPFLLLPSKLL